MKLCGKRDMDVCAVLITGSCQCTILCLVSKTWRRLGKAGLAFDMFFLIDDTILYAFSYGWLTIRPVVTEPFLEPSLILV